MEKLRTGLYRLEWHIHTDNHIYTNYFSSTVDLISFGIDECYKITYRGAVRSDGAYLKLTLQTTDRNTDFQQRKVTAKSLGHKQTMFFIHQQNTSDYSKGVTSRREGNAFQTITGQQEDRQEETLVYNWRAEWTDITLNQSIKYCRSCQSSRCIAEWFEILIDMDPKNSLDQGQQNVSSNFSHLWESKKFADVTFRCEDKDIEAHKCIVSCGSPVLAVMIQSDFKEKQERIVEIKETKAKHKNSEAIVSSRPDDWMSFNKNYPELVVAAVQFMVKKNVDQKCRYLFEAEMYEELNKKMLEELMADGYQSES